MLPGTEGELGAELVRAFELVRQAGAEVYALQRGEKLAVEMKPGDEPVTIADRLGSEIICAGLAASFPADPVISEELLSPRIRQHAAAFDPMPHADSAHSLPAALESLERRMISDALRRHQGNKTRASADLKVSRRNLIRLVQKYGLEDARS